MLIICGKWYGELNDKRAAPVPTLSTAQAQSKGFWARLFGA